STWSVLPQGCWERATDCPNLSFPRGTSVVCPILSVPAARLGRMSAGMPLIAGAGRGDDRYSLGIDAESSERRLRVYVEAGERLFQVFDRIRLLQQRRAFDEQLPHS